MREKLFQFILYVGFGILVSRLFVLQVVQGNYWRQIAEGNRIKVDPQAALRGIIYDRNAKALVRNTPQGREYLYAWELSGILGYIGQVTPEDLDLKIGGVPLYKTGDLAGKMGIESQYDRVLRGKDGGVIKEIDAKGQTVRQLGREEPVSGQSLNLTIDADLQKKAYEAMKAKTGAVIVSDPQTGEILALVNTPSFDANTFTIRRKQSDIETILNDKNQPMFNRAIAGLYPPGSPFKIVTSLAALSEGKITKDTQIEDTGEIHVGRWTFGNWYFKQYGKTDGPLNIVGAIKRSNDIFFYNIGDWVGGDKLAVWAKKLGYGEKTGIDLPGEESGLVPDKKWKKEFKNEDWYQGDNFITAIGQGDLLVTPLQMNTLTSFIASDGKWCQPNLVQKSKIKNQKCRNLGVKKEYVDLVKEGMHEACNPGGTGYAFFDFGMGGPSTSSADLPTGQAGFKRIEVGCKTGTAESPGEKSLPHAWFTVFAPQDNPKIALTVLVEKGGEGSSVAGPIARDILKWYFENE